MKFGNLGYATSLPARRSICRPTRGSPFAALQYQRRHRRGRGDVPDAAWRGHPVERLV